MSDLYLIAHRVRNEPAFDIATRMMCSVCIGEGQRYELMTGCHECDCLGYWWIIPTSGHRAYPYWHDSLQWYLDEMVNVPTMPPDLQDHYHLDQPAAPNQPSLLSRLNLKPAPQPPIVRRI